MSDQHTYRLTLKGRLQPDEVNAGSPQHLTITARGGATRVTVETDQSGLIGVVRHLHGHGFTILSANAGGITRRRFLQGLGLAGVTATLTAAGLTAAAPDPAPVHKAHWTFEGDHMKTLIVYATDHGSTMEVAAAVGETLGANGHHAEVVPVEQAPPLAEYDAVLIGSAVQYGTWLPAAVDYIKRHSDALAALPHAVFSVHIRNTDSASRAARLAYLDEVRPFLQPIAEGYFAGRFNRGGAARLLPRWAARLVPPIDMRDWDAIHAWAASLGTRLQTASVER